jgi:hypothetical protein
MMDAVAALTGSNKAGYPPHLFAIPGTIDRDAKWTEAIQTDLVQELFEHLYQASKDTKVVTGNQFAYIEGAARTIQSARNLIRMHLKRVLNARFTQTAFGRASETMFDALKEAPFIDTTPRTKQFRQKLIGISGWETVSTHDEGVSLGLAVHEFTLMKRNKPKLGDTSKEGPQRAVIWYKTDEYVKAICRIIVHVSKGPVTPDYLSQALEQAFRALDTYRDSRPTGDENGVEGAEIEEIPPQPGSDVRNDQPSGLYIDVPLEVEEEVTALVQIMYEELTKRHPTRDIEILYGLSVGKKIMDVAEEHQVDVRTVLRRKGEIESLIEEWSKEYGDQIVGISLQSIFGDRTTMDGDV